MDGGAWWATVHGVTKSRTRLSDFTAYLDFPGGSDHKLLIDKFRLKLKKVGKTTGSFRYIYIFISLNIFR